MILDEVAPWPPPLVRVGDVLTVKHYPELWRVTAIGPHSVSVMPTIARTGYPELDHLWKVRS